MSRVAAPGDGVRVVAIGYQGFGNVGDEAILTGIEALLDGSGVTVGWVVCGPQPDSVAAFAKAPRIVAPRLIPTMRALRAIARSDGLLLSGGGLIHDHWPTIIPRYLLWIGIARALGRRVVWLGVGVGPIRRRSQRWLARLALWLTSATFVRDDESAALLGGSSGKVTVAPDAAIFNPTPDTVNRDERRIAVIVRGPIATTGDPAALAGRLVEVVSGLRDHDRDPVVLTMGGRADEGITGELLDAAARAATSLDVVVLGPRPDDALRALAACSAAISIRLHGLILAAAAGVPCVPVAYDAKVRSAADALGLAGVTIGLDELGTEMVLERLTRAADAMPETARRVAAMREHGPAIAREVAAAFEGRPR